MRLNGDFWPLYLVRKRKQKTPSIFYKRTFIYKYIKVVSSSDNWLILIDTPQIHKCTEALYSHHIIRIFTFYPCQKIQSTPESASFEVIFRWIHWMDLDHLVQASKLNEDRRSHQVRAEVVFYIYVRMRPTELMAPRIRSKIVFGVGWGRFTQRGETSSSFIAYGNLLLKGKYDKTGKIFQRKRYIFVLVYTIKFILEAIKIHHFVSLLLLLK